MTPKAYDAGILLADTITRLPYEAAGAVVVSGSHGGCYPAQLAAKAKVRAVILNDAGFGLDEAGRADVVVDFVGRPASLAWALGALDVGGRLVVLTTFEGVEFPPLSPRDLVLRHASIAGSRFASRSAFAGDAAY